METRKVVIRLPGVSMHAEQPGTSAGNDIHVLVVDDDYSVRDLVALTLNHRGYQVTVAANGRIGVEHVRAAPDRYDLVLLDCQMPEMDGWSARNAIIGCAPGTPVVMMSTQAVKFDEDPAGASLFLRKPFAARELVEFVDLQLDRRI